MNVDVLIVGGGFAGLKCALQLSGVLGHTHRIALLTADEQMTLRPRLRQLAEGEETLTDIRLERVTDSSNLDIIVDTADEIDIAAHLLRTVTGHTIEWNILVLAAGVRYRVDTIPGLTEVAWPYWTRQAWTDLPQQLELLSGHTGRPRRLALVLCPGNACPDPFYNAAGTIHRWLRQRARRKQVELILATWERHACALFGTDDAEAVADYVAWQVDQLWCNFQATAFVDNTIAIGGGNLRLEADQILALPPQRPALSVPGLPTDDDGFYRIETDSCRVERHPDVFAIGDIASGAPRQAWRAVLHAERAAAWIVSTLTGRPPLLVEFPERRLESELIHSGGFPNRSHWWN